MKRSIFVGLLAVYASACQTTMPVKADVNWMSELTQADIVILGETHDNPFHHEKQAEIIAAISPDFVVFEMVPSALTDRVNEAISEGDDLSEVLSWAESGWPDFELYRPVFDASRNAVIVGAGLPRDRVRQSMTEGAHTVSGLPETYGLSVPLSEDRIETLTQEFMDSHCNMISVDMARSMIEAQRLRDAVFASHTVDAHRQFRNNLLVVLIAGSGHARKDYGVPAYLKRVEPSLDIIVIGLVEIGTESTHHHLYDHVIVTAAAERDDPCADFNAKN